MAIARHIEKGHTLELLFRKEQSDSKMGEKMLRLQAGERIQSGEWTVRVKGKEGDSANL